MSGIFSHIWVIAAPVFMHLFCSMKSPRFAAHKSPNDHWGFHLPVGRQLWQNKKAGYRLRTKNEHMKFTRPAGHPSTNVYWGFPARPVRRAFGN